MTAFVRWIDAPPVSPRLYKPVALGLSAGYLLVLLGGLPAYRRAARTAARMTRRAQVILDSRSISG